MAKVKTPRWGWALTGSGHFFKECLGMVAAIGEVDLFVSKAANEVLRMYRQNLKLPKSTRVFQDKTASAAPVAPSTTAPITPWLSGRQHRTQSPSVSRAFRTRW